MIYLCIQAQTLSVTLNVIPRTSIIADEFRDVLLHVDKKKIIQLIKNLLSNAIKFTPPHGIVTVAVSLIKKNASLRKFELPRNRNYLKLTVSDTGAGIPAVSIIY